ncbi:MAG TPA: chloride channel protein [Candidatus Binatia bacterium]
MSAACQTQAAPSGIAPAPRPPVATAAPGLTQVDELGDFTTTARVLPLTLLACGIGALSAVVAFALLRAIALFTNLFFFQRLSFAAVSPAQNTLGAAAVVVPVIGALVIGVIARYGSEKIRGHGIPEAIESILIHGSRIQPRVALLKPLSSAISIGSGGPFGAEGPIIMTGGALGSLVAQTLRLTAAERKTLLVAGAAAGMSATFNSPLAAALLAVELLLFEWKPRSFIPVALASATAACIRPLLLGSGPLFPLQLPAVHPDVALAAACVACGVIAGAASGLLTRAVYLFEDAFQRLPIHWMWWPAVGGLAIGLGGLIEPRALGVGYDVIDSLLRGGIVGRALVVLMVVKALIWSISLGSGTSGGVLAPLLIMGAAIGGLEASWFPKVGEGFWPLLGMAAMLGGTMRSPLTGVVFALELTQAWGAALALLIAVPIAHAFTVLALRRSILTEKVSRRGFHLSREYSTDPLEILFVREVMRTSVRVLPASLHRGDFRPPADSTSSLRQLFHVVDEDGGLVGVTTRTDVNSWLLGDGGSPPTLGGIARKPVVAHADEPLRIAVHRMATTGRTLLPVVAGRDGRKMVGEIALEDMLKARIQHLEEEQRRERVLPLSAIAPGWLVRARKTLALRVSSR